jgi:hypothetical protein
MTATKRKLDFTTTKDIGSKKNIIETYVGDYENNKKHGHGICYYYNGDTYDGMFDNDKKNGNGVYVSISTGRKYSGSWKNDKMHGIGVMTNKNEKYIGMWNNGKLIQKKESVH